MDRRRVLAARIIAVVADAVQFGLMPLFAGGAPAAFDAVLDIAVGAVMVALLGWHWAFVPAFAFELLPGIDLAPTWTIAVFIVTRGTGRPAAHAPEPPASALGSPGQRALPTSQPRPMAPQEPE